MTLSERIQKLMSELETGLIERDGIFKLAFLAIVTQQTTYLFGRAGSGKQALIRHLLGGFKDLKTQIYGRRSFDLPTADAPTDIAVFTSFDSGFSPMTSAISAILDEHLAEELFLAGRLRPDSALAEAKLSDSIHLVLTLPDSVSPDSLQALLSNAGDPNRYSVSEDLKITRAELTDWTSAIEQVNISDDCITVLKKIAEECERGNIYISAKRWRGLAKMARAQAFFAGRNETNVTDLLFLSENLWGKRTTAEAISKGFDEGFQDFLNTYAPDPEAFKASMHDLLLSAEHFKNSNGSRYKTTKIDGEEYISYSITVFNEPITLFAPLSRVGTNEDFYPLNMLHRVEYRAKCNFMGGDICKISIDAKAKRNGMRASSAITNATAPAPNTVFEDYAKLPSEILQINDAEIIEQDKMGLQSAHEKLYEIITQTIQCLKNLKAIYTKSAEYQNDPFLSMDKFKMFMDGILKRYKALADLSKELQQYEAFLTEDSAGVN